MVSWEAAAAVAKGCGLSPAGLARHGGASKKGRAPATMPAHGAPSNAIRRTKASRAGCLLELWRPCSRSDTTAAAT
jgi:hypothetical protein